MSKYIELAYMKAEDAIKTESHMCIPDIQN